MGRRSSNVPFPRCLSLSHIHIPEPDKRSAPFSVSKFLNDASDAFTFCAYHAQLLLQFYVYPDFGSGKRRRIFGTGVMWFVNMVRLVLFATVLLPGFLQVVWYYITTPYIVRNIPYGLHHRQSLDVYLPDPKKSKDDLKPVVVFFCGGAWTIGYKAWGALMGKLLVEHGIVYVTPDYRNFPQATVPDMVRDCRTALQWVTDNIEKYGGDPGNVFVVGQSAGAHLSFLMMLAQVQREVDIETGNSDSEPEEEEHASRWTANCVRAYMGISGPYDILALMPFFASRGLHGSVIRSIFGSRPKAKRKEPRRASSNSTISRKGSRYSLPKQRGSRATLADDAWIEELSPTALLRNSIVVPEAVQRLPPVLLVHGDKDQTCPVQSTTELYDVLRLVGGETLPLNLKIYSGKSHTDAIIEDPMQGSDGQLDPLIYDMLELVESYSSTTFCMQKTKSSVALLPRSIVRLGAQLNPF